MAVLTQARLKERYIYNPDTGVFTWRITLSKTIWAGDKVGICKKGGYEFIGITINGKKKRYPAHRLAFLYMEGYLPEHHVDHINGIRDDNRWCNLRHATAACNAQNTGLHWASTSGYKGVIWDKQKNRWRAKIKLHGLDIHLGYHDTALDAALARITFEDWCPRWHCSARCENRIKVFSDLKNEPDSIVRDDTMVNGIKV